MRKLTMRLLGIMSSCLVVLPAIAQQADSTVLLPDAKPGECYAKVNIPPQFETGTEKLVIQEASERIETQEAQFETVNEEVMVKEASQTIEVSPTVFSNQTEKVETQAAELRWISRSGGSVFPASPDSVEQIARSGKNLKAVKLDSCFVEYFADAQYRTEPVEVMVKEATQSIKVIPAKYEMVEEQIVVKEASSKLVDVPAVYRTVSESVLVEPARSVWREDCGVVERLANATGEVMCLVEVPARYETLMKTVLEKPASTMRVDVPAEYKTISVERLVSPASEVFVDVPAEYTVVERRVKVKEPTFTWLEKGETPDEGLTETGREVCLTEQPAETVDIVRAVVSSPAVATTIDVPAEVESVKVQRLLSEASEQRIKVPARTKTVSTQVQTVAGTIEWKQVLCKVNMTQDIISKMQEALKREGYNPGPVDGLLGKATLNAIEKYQIREGIDSGGITLQSLKRLKVAY